MTNTIKLSDLGSIAANAHTVLFFVSDKPEETDEYLQQIRTNKPVEYRNWLRAVRDLARITDRMCSQIEIPIELKIVNDRKDQQSLINSKIDRNVLLHGRSKSPGSE